MKARCLRCEELKPVTVDWSWSFEGGLCPPCKIEDANDDIGALLDKHLAAMAGMGDVSALLVDAPGPSELKAILA